MREKESWLPLFPLQLVLLPDERLPLHIFEQRYQVMIRRCQASGESFGVILGRGEELALVGCAAVVAEVWQHYPDGRSDIVTVGGDRFLCREVRAHEDGYLEALTAAYRDSPVVLPTASGPLLLELLGQLRQEQGHDPDPEASAEPIDPSVPGYTFRIAAECPMALVEKQALLEQQAEVAREESLLQLLVVAIPRARSQRADRYRASSNGHLKHG